jgi:hypothetical protein
MGVATHGLAAISIIRQELGFVADPDLAHLDASLKFASEIFDQLAKIHALFREKVEDDPLSAEQVLDVDERHLQPAILDKSLADIELAPAVLKDAIQGPSVVLGHSPHDSAVGRFPDPGKRLRSGIAENLADFVTAIGVDDYFGAARAGEILACLELTEKAHGTMANNKAIGHETSSYGLAQARLFSGLPL